MKVKDKMYQDLVGIVYVCVGRKGEEEKLRNLVRTVGGRKQLEFNVGFFLPICGLTQLLVVLFPHLCDELYHSVAL